MIAFLNIEKVIKVIREAEDTKTALMSTFKLSEIQTEDILEIRLRQLARLEGIKIETELAELRAEQDKLNKLLASEPARRKFLVGEIEQDAKKFGDDRRTLVQEAEKVTASKVEIAVDEDATVLMSKNGFLRLRTGHNVDRATLNWKEGDGEMAVLETRTVWPLIFFADNGRVFSIKPAELPSGKGDGMPVGSFIDPQGAKIVAVLTAAPDTRVRIASSGGYGFTCQIGDMVTRQRVGKAFVTVEAGEAMLPPFLAPTSVKELAALSGEGRVLVLPAEEVKSLSGGGKGVVVMGLHGGEKLLGLCPVTGTLGVRLARKISNTTAGTARVPGVCCRQISRP